MEHYRIFLRRLGPMAAMCLTLSGCFVGILDAPAEDGLARSHALDNLFFTLEVAGQGLVQVHGVNGRVTVRGSPGADEVFIAATRKVGAGTSHMAQSHLPDLQVLLSRAGEGILVESSHPLSTEEISYEVVYDILVPPDLKVEIFQANGEVLVQDMGADVRVENLNGNVKIEDLVGGAWVSVADGQVDSDVFLPHGKAVRHTVGKGGIKLRLQKEVSASLSAQVGNGVITLSGLDPVGWVQGTSSLKGILGIGSGTVDLHVSNGGIDIRGG